MDIHRSMDIQMDIHRSMDNWRPISIKHGYPLRNVLARIPVLRYQCGYLRLYGLLKTDIQKSWISMLISDFWKSMHGFATDSRTREHLAAPLRGCIMGNWKVELWEGCVQNCNFVRGCVDRNCVSPPMADERPSAIATTTTVVTPATPALQPTPAAGTSLSSPRIHTELQVSYRNCCEDEMIRIGWGNPH